MNPIIAFRSSPFPATMLCWFWPSIGRRSSNDADDPQHADEQHVADWTQLPEGCRVLVMERMDSYTRAAWRATCRLTCQDVRAATRTLTWHGRDIGGQNRRHLANVPLPLTSPLDRHPTALPAAFLSSLPSLHHLNCSDMAELSSIQGIPPTLRSLDLCDCKQLQHVLPLQHCTTLEQLALFGRTPSDCAPLPSCLSVTSSGLRRLSLIASCSAAPETAEAIARSLERLTRLQELTLLLRTNSSRVWQTLTTNLARMTDLRVLDLSNSDLGQGLAVLSAAIRQLRHLQCLNLFGNRPDAAATTALAQAISSLPPTLTRLELGCMDISDPEAATLVASLHAHSATLRTIGMRESIRGPLSMAAAASALQQCSALTSLELSCWALTEGDAGVAALATALSGSAHCLTALSVTRSYSRRGLAHISTAALAPLTEVLSCMSALASLNLWGSWLQLGPASPAGSDDVVLSAIAPSLTSVNLSSNPFGDTGAAVLATALARLTALTNVDLGYCGLGVVGVATLIPALPSTLTSLSLPGNHLGDAGVAALATALRCKSALTLLNCKSVEAGPAGATALASALPSLARLRHLSLGCNPLGFQGLRALAQGLQALSKPQAWTIWFYCKLMKGDALCGRRDSCALASILDGHGMTRPCRLELSPELPARGSKLEGAAATSRVLGLDVGLL